MLIGSNTPGGDALLDEPRRQHLAGNDERQRTTRAREAAEALFAPKPSTPKTLRTKGPPSARLPEHKPRVLSISPPQPAAREEADPAMPLTSRVPSGIHGSEIARIRAWLKYGMTIAQAAAVYETTVDEIERALRLF